MKAAFGASVVACAALAVAAPACAQTRLGAIVATVRDARNLPVSRALVSVSGPADRSATTSSAGLVTLLGLPSGTYTVRVTRSGFSPQGTVVRVAAAGTGVTLVPLRLAEETFASAAGAGSSVTSAVARGAGVPYVPAALSHDVAAAIVPGATPGDPAGATLEATRADETRLELDGIPLAGNAWNLAALRYRSALDLDDVVLSEGPVLGLPDLDGAIGGVVDYRTPDIASGALGAFDIGHDSAFGAFEHLRFGDTFGKAGVLVDGVDVQGGNTATVLKGALELSGATGLDVESFSSHVAPGDPGSVSGDAPAYAAALHTTFGSAALQARAFDSASDLTSGASDAEPSDDFRTRGYALGAQVPVGENVLQAGYERRDDSAAFDAAPAVTQSIESLTLGGNFQLSHLSRLSLGDDISRGSLLPARSDPHAALTVRASNAVTVSLAAGSAYETVPDAVLAAAPAVRFEPETSFGYRAGAEITDAAGDRFRAGVFALRRFDAFAPLADARSEGAELGYARPAVPKHVGFDADLALVRSIAYGPPQPHARYDDPYGPFAAQQALGQPYSRVRAALTYTLSGTEVDFGATELGAGNPFADHAVTLGNASVRAALGTFGAVRLGLENCFGTRAASPQLDALLPAREFTLTLER